MITHRASDNPELRAALNKLFSLQTFGIKLGLEPISLLLQEFGSPHLRFPTIHVAGTNGKGSVCALIAATLRAAGLRVGLYSSPHLVDFEERIRVDGRAIDADRLGVYAREMMPAIERIGCTFFEGTTAMGFRYFAEEQVDIAVIETGMGGRLDATNVLSPLVSAVTSISFDHTKHLGETLELIAGEKAGIIKPETPAVIGHIAPRLREVFAGKAGDVGAPLLFVDDFCRAVYDTMTFDATVASFMINGREVPRLEIGLVGRHQIQNARVALSVIEQVWERFGFDETIVRNGFANVRELAGIRGRFETVSTAPRTIIDVAHNPDGARVLAETLAALSDGGRIIRFVYGSVEDKDVREIVEFFRPLAVKLHAVRAESHRSLPADEVAYRAEAAGIPTVIAGSVREGMEQALTEAGADEVVVICGSFYVVGEAVRELETASVEDIIARSAAMLKERAGTGAAVTGAAVTRRKRRTSTTTEDVHSAVTNEGIDAGHFDTAAPGTGERIDRHVSVKQWHPSEQPRERLMRLGAGSLSNAELLAILLRTGSKGEDVIRVSRNLLRRFNDSFSDLALRDYKELQKVKGIGPAKAVTLAAAFELGRRIKIEPFSNRPMITSPADVARLYIPMLRDIRKEQFHVLILNTANQVIRMELISEGNLNSSIAHPREVYRTAIVESAAAIIGLHNHPSGNPTPSKEDIAITKQLVESGKVIGIPFHDHIIIAGEEYVSLAERGYV